jgi:hypothetical protein
MRIIGDVHFVVEDGRLFLTCDSEKESDDWSFFVLSKVPVFSELKTSISISNYKNIERGMRLEIEFGLELEKVKDRDGKIDDSFSIFLFIDDEFGDELLWSLSVFNLGGKSDRTRLLPISEGTALELEGTYHKLKVKILNVKPILKF